MNQKPVKANITSYHDFFEWWYDPETGEHLKLDGKEVSIKEFNESQESAE